jgi:hypothetical protein
MIDWKQIVSPDFFFKIDRVRLHRSDWAVLIVGALLLIAGIMASVYKRSRQVPYAKILIARLVRLYITIGILFVLWFAFRYEVVRWFGTRFAAVLILVYGLVWLGFIAADYFKNYRPNKELWEKEQLKNKYLTQK